MTGNLLDVRTLSRNFGGLKALDQVNLRLERGEILGLIGPNGAGKSTLFNCLAGNLRPTAGTVSFNGRDVTRMRASQRARLGIARTFQLGKVFPSMTVRENVLTGLGVARYSSFWRSVTGLVKGAEQMDRAAEILRQFELEDQASVPVTELPMGFQRRVEAARAIATSPRLLLLDEPAAGLTHGEAERFADMVRGVRASGVTVIVIEHNMRFAMALAERLYVLVQGRIIAEGPPDAVRQDPGVISAYLG